MTNMCCIEVRLFQLIKEQGLPMIKQQFTNTFKDKHLMKELVSHLETTDILELGLVNKQVRKLAKPFEPKPQTKKQQKNTKPKKPKSPPAIEVKITNDTFKLSLFTLKTLPKFILSDVVKNWEYFPPLAQKVIPNIEQSAYAGFKSKINGKNMFFVHRGLIDRSLEYYKGGFDGQEEEDYEELYEGKQFTENFDFSSPQSLRQRQRQLLGMLNEKEIQRQNKEVYQNQYEAEKIKDIKRISIILCFGGSFSLGVFENGKCILHKSDKKYVNRGKAGGRQLNRDKSSGSNIQSMGSQIRRHQEKLHQLNVSLILEEAEKELEQSDIIFLQAPGLNRKIIIENSEALSKLKSKLRSVCQAARKANYQNVEELYQILTKVYVLEVKQ